MDNPVILSACRTPIGKFRGALARLSAPELGATAIKSAVERAGLSGREVDEVIMGNVLSAGVGQAPARQAALRAGLHHSVAALTINKMCGSGLKAVMLAANAIRSGDAEVIVAGGMESMSNAPHLLPRAGRKLGDLTLIDSMLHDGLICPFSQKGMGQIADQLAESDGIQRAAQDQFAFESHRRAITAIDRGDFDSEIVPLDLRQFTMRIDEGPRRDIDLDALSKLPAMFAEDGSVTAGNASMISDGAAAVVVASKRFASSHGCSPLAEIVASATVGTSPEDLFIAPVTVIEKILAACHRQLNEIGLLEINEAFAAAMLACFNRLEVSQQRVNIRGGAIALGHPIGASGARVLTTLVHALNAHDIELGLAALCLGGGNAVAMLVQRQ